MKPVSNIAENKKILRQLLFIAGLLILLHSPGSVYAQSDSTKTDSTATEEPAVEEESSLISPTLEFITVQKSNNTIDLKAAMRAKVKGSVYKLPLVKITFIQVRDAEEIQLGFVITDKQGKAVLNVKADSLLTDQEGKLHFKAMYAGNKQMESAEEEVTIKRARLELVPLKEDSLLTVTLKLTELGRGEEKPVPEAVLGVFANRLFNPLKIVEGTTDESGEVSVEIPSNLPGDAKGNLTLIARLDENETYGNMEASVIQPWGVPVSDKIQAQPRALWSSHPPIWMLVTFIVLMSIVWGHYIVIVYQLLRLRKEEPHPPMPTINS
jgi:hypothetical protein